MSRVDCGFFASGCRRRSTRAWTGRVQLAELQRDRHEAFRELLAVLGGALLRGDREADRDRECEERDGERDEDARRERLARLRRLGAKELRSVHVSRSFRAHRGLEHDDGGEIDDAVRRTSLNAAHARRASRDDRPAAERRGPRARCSAMPRATSGIVTGRRPPAPEQRASSRLRSNSSGARPRRGRAPRRGAS